MNNELCGAAIYWWNGEYDGNCELPKDHLEPFHYDGITHYDSDNNDRSLEQERLTTLIANQRQEAIQEFAEKSRRRLHDIYEPANWLIDEAIDTLLKETEK